MQETIPGMAEAIEQRRRERELSPGAFADAAGLTVQGLQPVRKGVKKAYQDKVRMGVARALGWPSNWYDRLLRGEDPSTFPATVHQKPTTIEDRLTALEERWARIEVLLAQAGSEPSRKRPEHLP